ncbi:MAG: HesB/IscA family protein [Candidatus Puniceispirillales bacterium]|nr:iron-sulfur cluster assembly accessory protein [Pseudomonadota bacterium]
MMTFSVSDQAADRIAKIMETEHGTYFRISVLGGGCSGFQYKFSIDDEKTDDDVVLNNATSTGVNVITLIDSMSLELISGGQLDFVNELAGQYFQVVNPNATAACGCGTSFAL